MEMPGDQSDALADIEVLHKKTETQNLIFKIKRNSDIYAMDMKTKTPIRILLIKRSSGAKLVRGCCSPNCQGYYASASCCFTCNVHLLSRSSCSHDHLL